MHKQQLFTIVSFLLFTCLISILAVKSLSERLSQVEFMKSLSDQATDQNYCTVGIKEPSGIISDACCEYETVEKMNDDLSPRLRELIKTDFFKYYKLKLYKECPFWSEYGQCINQACAVETTDETDVPEMWRSNVLGALQTSQAGTLFQPFIKCEYTDQDFCVVEDETDSEGVFVNLLDNPERFTGYAGTSAGRVWKSIYEENCFNVVSSMDPANNNLASVPTSKNQLPEDMAQKIDTTDIEEVCFEKRVYYRLISGLHSSISIHICDEYLNQTTGQWGPNLECFINRIGSHPERLQNIYFSYVVLLRAISKAADYLNGYEFCTGDKIQDLQVKAMVGELVNKTRSCPETFDEKQMFASPESRSLKEEFKNRFRNVSRIMDCVGCDKCRLWGKLQISGLGTALKVLFSYEDEFFNPKVNPNLLTRTEIVALFNTFHRFSESLTSIELFRQMYQEKINEAAKSEIESTKSIINQLLESLPEKYIEAIISIKDLLSSYLIQFNRLIIQQLEYWDIPVPVLLTSSTAS